MARVYTGEGSMRIKGTSGQAFAAGLTALLLMGMASPAAQARNTLTTRATERAILSGAINGAAGRFLHGAGATPVSCAPWQAVAHPSSGLAGIAAVSTNDVWAVGAMDQEGGEQPLIEHWDGKVWRIVSSPASARGRLVAVAALAPDDVWAVGDRAEQPLIEHWDGRRWSVVPGAVSGAYHLTGVAGASRRDVWAVGAGSSGTGTLIEHWNGQRWSMTPGAPLGRYGGGLAGVAAVSTNDVWAVGDAAVVGRGALIEHWDGKSWRVAPSPALGTVGGRLASVAGITADDIWAVGSYAKNYYYGDAVIEHWDGKSWRTVPGQTAVSGGLTRVAVVSRRDAWAVGGSLVEHWDGARWRRVPSPSGGLGALAVVSPDDIWGAGATLEHYTGMLCDAPDARTRTIALSNVGIQGNDEGTTSDAPGALAVDGATGHAFVRDSSGTVSALDPARGVVLTRVHAGDTAGPLAVDEQGGRVFVPIGGDNGAAGSVAVLDAVTGALRRAIPAAPHTSLIGVDARKGHLFVAAGASQTTDQGGQVSNKEDGSVLDAATGAAIATVPVSNPTALAVDSAAGRVYVASNGHSSFAGNGPPPSLTMLDAATGAVIRTVAGVGGLIAVDEAAGRVFVGQVDGGSGQPLRLHVNVLDATSGALLRTTTIGENGDAYLAALAVDRRAGRVYVDSYFGVSVLDATSGKPLTTLVVGSPMTIAVDERTGRLYATYVESTNQYGIPTGPGSVEVFDPSTGALLAKAPVGMGPDAVAIDDKTGQALVLDQDGVTALDLNAGAPVPARPSSPADPVMPIAGARYFPQSRHTLGEPFLSFWLRYGGADIFGYPRTEPFVGDARLTQYTERALLQVVDGQVTPAPLGRLLTRGRAFPPVAPFPSTRDRVYVPATRHSLSGRFLAYWRARHGDVVLGAPISEVIVEGNGDGSGRRYPLQWFERGRLEYHAEHAGTRYEVQLGLLGVQALRLSHDA